MDAPTKTRVERGDELELTVDSLAFGGAGVARRDGYVVFVRDAVPGDTVRAVVTKRKKAYAEARTVALLEAGPERIEAVAAHPGAPWQVLPYERQIAIKAEQVQDALQQIEHVEDCLLASEAGNEARRAALRWCRERGLRAYDRRAQTGLLRNLVVREGRRTGELQIRIVASDEGLAASDFDGFAEAVGAGSVVWTRALDVGETTAGGISEVL